MSSLCSIIVVMFQERMTFWSLIYERDSLSEKKKVPKEDSTFMFSHFLLYSLRLLPEQSTKNTSSTNKHIYKTSGFQSVKTYLISM